MHLLTRAIEASVDCRLVGMLGAVSSRIERCFMTSWAAIERGWVGEKGEGETDPQHVRQDSTR